MDVEPDAETGPTVGGEKQAGDAEAPAAETQRGSHKDDSHHQHDEHPTALGRAPEGSNWRAAAEAALYFSPIAPFFSPTPVEAETEHPRTGQSRSASQSGGPPGTRRRRGDTVEETHSEKPDEQGTSAPRRPSKGRSTSPNSDRGHSTETGGPGKATPDRGLSSNVGFFVNIESGTTVESGVTPELTPFRS